MVILACLRWWYGSGLQWAWQRTVKQRLAASADRFSLVSLIKTWLAPYKQTFTGASGGSLDSRWRAAVDGLVSRTVGFLVRSLIIVAGLFNLLFVLVSGAILVSFWPFLPVLVLISVIFRGLS